MGTPIRDGTLTPKDLRYYAPRKLRDDDVSDWPSFQFSSDATEAQNTNVPGDPKPDALAPLPDMFNPSASSEIDGKIRPTRFARLKVLALVGGAAAVGLFIGITLLDAIQGRDEAPPKAPEIPLAARLQSATTDLQKVSQPVVAPRLSASDASGDMNVPLPLGLEVKNYTAGAVVELSGLPAGAALSNGNAIGNGQWRIAVDDLPKTRVTPPPDYVGSLTLTARIAVGNGQAAVRSPVRLTWRQIPPAPEKLVALRTPSPEPAPVKSAEVTPPPPASAKIEAPAEPKKIEKPAAPVEAKKTETPLAPAKTDAAVAPRKMDTSVVIALLRRADELMAAGDLAAARLLLQRVAETKNAQAAFRLASTYDPAVLKKLSNNSVAADPALAQLWYERARDWGSPDATSPLEALASRATAK